MKHILQNVILTDFGWSAVCSCGKWAISGCDTARTLRKFHKEHKKNA